MFSVRSRPHTPADTAGIQSRTTNTESINRLALSILATVATYFLCPGPVFLITAWISIIINLTQDQGALSADLPSPRLIPYFPTTPGDQSAPIITGTKIAHSTASSDRRGLSAPTRQSKKKGKMQSSFGWANRLMGRSYPFYIQKHHSSDLSSTSSEGSDDESMSSSNDVGGSGDY
jgi:hypothetical protein